MPPLLSRTGVLIPTSMAGDYGHLGYRALNFASNQTYRDFTCNYDKADPETGRKGFA